MDSNKGGLEESDSELEEGIGGGVGGDALGKPLPKHLGHEHRLSQWQGRGNPVERGLESYLRILAGCKLY